MKRFTMMLAAVLLMAGAAFVPAKAGTIGLDPTPTDDQGFFVTKGSGDNNSTKFTLTQGANVTINLLGLGIPHVSLTLYACGDANCTTKSVVAPDAPGGSLNSLILLSTAEFTYSGLLSTTKYLISISGAPLLGVGFVLGNISAAVTPIPASLLMFLTALGGLGFMAKRRKTLSAAIA